MRISVIKTNRDAIIFAIGVTIACVVITALATSAVFNLFKPQTHLAYVLSASLIIAVVAPSVVGVLAANVLHIEKIRTELEQQAHADPLTGLLNRRAFFEILSREHRRMERTHSKCALIMIDIDHFKHINDLHGHAAGDLVLQSIAGALKSGLRPSMDYVARWGGEEFVALLTHTELDGAVTAAERLRAKVEKLDPSIGKVRLGVSASFGVTELLIGTEFDDALDHADRCLYAAKAAGRNHVVAAKLPRLADVAEPDEQSPGLKKRQPDYV